MEPTFMQMLQNNAKTLNGAVSNKSTLNKSLDLFSLGATTDNDHKEQLILEAMVSNPTEAIKVVMYLRDCRGGQGNKDTLRIFNKIVLTKLANYSDFMTGYHKLLKHIPEIGSWKDVYDLYGKNEVLDALILDFVEQNLTTNNLCAKWFPRQSKFHQDFATFTGKGLGAIRRLVASCTNVIETQMCSGHWHEINYSHVPSVAFKKYTKAFKRNDSSRFDDFLEKANSGEVKVNASVIYPHDIVSRAMSYMSGKTEIAAANAQWKNLPNFMPTPMNILPIIDVSGSMTTSVPGTTVRALDIAIGLGLYFAEHNHGEFKDTWINFSSKPSVQKLKGTSLSERINNLDFRDWSQRTNLQVVFDLMIPLSLKAPESSPKVLLIISDMEFNSCGSSSNYETAKAKYLAAGLELPLVIFWRVDTKTSQQPVTMKDENTMLINGFSPAIMKLITEMNSEDLKNITPYNMMLKAIEKYNYVDTYFNV